MAEIPLFPLHTVLLPGVHLPLHIFEPRYRQLTKDLINGELPDREFGVIAIKDALTSDVHAVGQLHPIGCTAVLREAEQLPAGQFDIVTTGRQRFRLIELATSDAPYLVGAVEYLADEQTPTDTDPAAIAASARHAHERYCESAWESGDWDQPPADTELDKLSYLLAADCLLPLADRQDLLAETNPVARLRLVTQLLNREAGFLGTLRAVPAQHTELNGLGTPATFN